MERKKIKSKYLIITYPVVFAILLLIAFFIGRLTAPKSVVSDQIVRNSSLLGKKQSINKSFSFPVKNDEGTVLTNLTYQIDSAELEYSIILNGQTASAVKGKIFLILNIQLTNNYDKNITINSRDYVRLTVNNDQQLLSPSMHNDPVEVDAISTKATRLGFAINETDKNLVLHIGEIDGKKTDLPLTILGK